MKKMSGSYAVYIVSAPVVDDGQQQTVTVTVRAQGPSYGRHPFTADVAVELFTPSPSSLTYPETCAETSSGSNLYVSDAIPRTSQTHVAARAIFTVGEDVVSIETRAPVGGLPSEPSSGRSTRRATSRRTKSRRGKRS